VHERRDGSLRVGKMPGTVSLCGRQRPQQVATATKKAPQARYAWGAASHCLSLLASDRAASGCRGMMPPGWASEDIDGVRPAQMQELATGAPWVCGRRPAAGGLGQYLISFTTCAQWRTPLADDVHGIPVARAAFISSLQVAITAISQKRRLMRFSIPGSRTHGLLCIQRLSRAFLASIVSNESKISAKQFVRQLTLHSPCALAKIDSILPRTWACSPRYAA